MVVSAGSVVLGGSVGCGVTRSGPQAVGARTSGPPSFVALSEHAEAGADAPPLPSPFGKHAFTPAATATQRSQSAATSPLDAPATTATTPSTGARRWVGRMLLVFCRTCSSWGEKNPVLSF